MADEVFGAIASHSTPTDDDSSWDGGAAEKAMTNNESNNKKMYAWRDPDGDPDARSSYKFPHHNVGDGGTPGAANTSGASAAIAALNGGRAGRPNIPASDRSGVHAHLARHLRDADKDVPELMTISDTDWTAMAVLDEPQTIEVVEQDKSFAIPVMVIEGAWTGDNRNIDPGVLTWRDLPLPVMALTKTTMGHDQAELVGKITSIERKDAAENGLVDSRTGEPYPEGTTYLSADGEFDTSEWAQEIYRLVDDEFLRGVSVDLSDVTSDVVFIDSDGNEVDGGDFWDWLFGDFDDTDLDIGEKIRAGRVMGCTICPFPAFEGAYIEIPTPLVASGFIATPESSSGHDERWPSIVNHDRPGMRQNLGLVAGAAPVQPPADWFQNPKFEAQCPLTIEASGRIYGHMATWAECHTSFDGQCIKAPHSMTEYAYFRTGSVLCDDGSLIPTGPITMGTGHAELWQDAVAAKAHYDNTGTVAADVVVGEDEIGIWFAGALSPEMDEISIRRFRGSALSGDWRTRGGSLELVATLAVNTPGFPVVRPIVRVASGAPFAMVAAGMLSRTRQNQDKQDTATSTGHRVVDDAYKDKVVRDALRNRVHND